MEKLPVVQHFSLQTKPIKDVHVELMPSCQLRPNSCACSAKIGSGEKVLKVRSIEPGSSEGGAIAFLTAQLWPLLFYHLIESHNRFKLLVPGTRTHPCYEL